MDRVATAGHGAKEAPGLEQASKRRPCRPRLLTTPSHPLKCPGARPGLGPRPCVLKPCPGLHWPVAWQPLPASQSRQDGVPAGQAEYHLVCRWGSWVPERGPQCSEPCPWSSFSSVALLPWPRFVPGIWCGPRAMVPPIEGVPQRGGGQGQAHASLPRWGAGGHPCGPVLRCWACVPGCRGEVGQRTELAGRPQSSHRYKERWALAGPRGLRGSKARTGGRAPGGAGWGVRERSRPKRGAREDTGCRRARPAGRQEKTRSGSAQP